VAVVLTTMQMTSNHEYHLGNKTLDLTINTKSGAFNQSSVKKASLFDTF
jgi:hypothetical protein